MLRKMGKKRIFSLACSNSVIALLSLLPILAFADPPAPPSNLQEVQANIANLRQDLQQQQMNRTQLQQALKKAEINLADLNQQQSKTQSEFQQHQSALQTLSGQQQQLQTDLQLQQQQLQEQVRAAYVLGGGENYWKVLLNQENPELLSRNMMYYQYYIRSRIQFIQQMQQNIQQFQENQQKMLAYKQSLAALQNQQAQQIEEIKNNQQSRQQSLSQINATILSKDQRLQGLLADEQALEKVVQNLDQQTAPAAPKQKNSAAKTSKNIAPALAESSTSKALTPTQASFIAFAKEQGKLPWPTKGKVGSGFNTHIEGSELKLNGVIIKASQGQTVQAIAPGRVVFAQWMSGYGLLVIIDHGQGYMTLYGRNGSINKKVGDMVAKGEEIASVGDSGGYSQPGLYFSIRKSGVPLDPSTWCRA